MICFSFYFAIIISRKEVSKKLAPRLELSDKHWRLVSFSALWPQVSLHCLLSNSFTPQLHHKPTPHINTLNLPSSFIHIFHVNSWLHFTTIKARHLSVINRRCGINTSCQSKTRSWNMRNTFMFNFVDWVDCVTWQLGKPTVQSSCQKSRKGKSFQENLWKSVVFTSTDAQMILRWHGRVAKIAKFEDTSE